MCQLSWNLGASTSWNPQGLCRPVQVLLYLTLEKYCYGINFSLLLFQDCPQHFISPLVYSDLLVHSLKVDRCWVRTPFMSTVGPKKYNLVFGLLWMNGLCMFRALLAHLQEALHKQQSVYCICIMSARCGFGGLGVSKLPSGTQDRGFEPGRSRRIFPAGKIHSMPSFGEEVK
jgi:hypothetical protein